MPMGISRRCASEQEVYELLGLALIEPELREDRGELEAAALSDPSAPGLPELISLQDIRGDLHSHTIASDGRNTITEMAKAARELGYEYLAITDHSASHGFGNDVSRKSCAGRSSAFKEANAAIEGIELLAGSEVNILPDGSLDYEDELLGSVGLGGGERAYRLWDRRTGNDRAHDHGHRAPPRGHHRPPHRAHDRTPRALRRRSGGGVRSRG